MRLAALLLALGPAVAMAGCGGPDTDPGGATPRVEVATPVLDPGPVGRWTLVRDPQLIGGLRKVAARQTEGAPSEVRVVADEALTGLTLRLHLLSDGTYELDGRLGRHYESAGGWTLQGDQLTLTATSVDGAPPRKPSVSRAVYDHDVIRLPLEGVPGLSEIVLRRE